MIEHAPFAVMSGAPWNVLDSRGARIALCGGDSNADCERYGPAIAAAIVKALNEYAALEEVMHWTQATLAAARPKATTGGSQSTVDGMTTDHPAWIEALKRAGYSVVPQQSVRGAGCELSELLRGQP